MNNIGVPPVSEESNPTDDVRRTAFALQAVGPTTDALVGWSTRTGQ
jgi:hypothetical protein